MRVSDVVDAMGLSAIAYSDEQPQLPGETVALLEDPDTGVQCFVRRRGQLLVITFRGSNSLQDWKTNLTFWKKCIPYDNANSKIRVHTGFVNAYKSPKIRGMLHRLVKIDVNKIRIYGHSQGAALALLCAVDLQYNFPDRDYEVIAFGAPRIGNKAFKKSYNKRVFKTFRVENGNDIVTKVPPAIWGYRHVGIKLHVGAPRIPGVISFEDHRPQRYYGNLFMRLLPQGMTDEESESWIQLIQSGTRC